MQNVQIERETQSKITITRTGNSHPKGENTEKQTKGWYIRKIISQKENKEVKMRFFPKRNFLFVKTNPYRRRDLTRNDKSRYKRSFQKASKNEVKKNAFKEV